MNESKTSFDSHPSRGYVFKRTTGKKIEIFDMDLADFAVIVNGKPVGLCHHEPWYLEDVVATFGFPVGDEVFLTRAHPASMEKRTTLIDNVCDFRLDDMDRIDTAPPVGGSA